MEVNMLRSPHYKSKKPENQPVSAAGPAEWESRQRDGRVNRLCACGAPAEVGVICNRCRVSNEFEE